MTFSSWNDFVHRLRERLSVSLPGFTAQQRMLPESRKGDHVEAAADARQSGVLILLYPEGGQVHLVLIERTNDGGAHSGQIALPGGKKETFDNSIYDTALREAYEEVSLDSATVEIIGRLSPLYIRVSNFEVHPVVAIATGRPELEGSAFEVARILEPALSEIFDAQSEAKVYSNTNPQLFWKAPVYMLPEETIVWGATAMILSELEVILKEIFD
jgi:8-oxo-dGTP pyrophosphatase MutT (NUDIX family)